MLRSLLVKSQVDTVLAGFLLLALVGRVSHGDLRDDERVLVSRITDGTHNSVYNIVPPSVLGHAMSSDDTQPAQHLRMFCVCVCVCDDVQVLETTGSVCFAHMPFSDHVNCGSRFPKCVGGVGGRGGIC